MIHNPVWHDLMWYGILFGKFVWGRIKKNKNIFIEFSIKVSVVNPLWSNTKEARQFLLLIVANIDANINQRF